MRKVWLLLVSLVVVVGLTSSGCAPELSGCAPGVVGGGAVAELEDKLDWVKDKLQSMQVELAALEGKLDWVKDKLGDMQVEIREIKPGAEVVGAEKLVGVGMLGETDEQWWDTIFIITNPDSEKNITVDKVVVTREDETLIYSGHYLIPTEGGMEKAADQILTPHEAWQLRLSQYKYDPDTEEWIDPEDAIDQDMEKYTVEVFWHADEDTCPLSGWFKQIKTTLVYDRECVLWEWYEEWDEYEQRYKHYMECLKWEEFPGYQKAVTEAPMVNVKQVH